MKTFILTTLMILSIGLTSATFAQTNIDSTQTSKYVYCELLGTQKFLSTKVTVSIDYGEERIFFQDTRMKDEQTGKVHAFNSMVDALNYMGNNGWEFAQAYVVTMGQQNVYHWLLKKKKE
jgi:extradiol dioxygenase family protein